MATAGRFVRKRELKVIVQSGALAVPTADITTCSSPAVSFDDVGKEQVAFVPFARVGAVACLATRCTVLVPLPKFALPPVTVTPPLSVVAPVTPSVPATVALPSNA